MRFLLLNQTFHPDVMATGQYLTETALALVERGHQVTVVTSRRAYDDPQRLFPKQETWRGVKILRIASTGFGKKARWRRAADFASFTVMCLFRLAFLPRQDVVVALTSPPLISFFGACLAKLRGSRFVYWVMDFNPDEAIAAGWLRAGSFAARVLESMSRFSLRRANKVIALDRFMADRINAKGIASDKVAVIPPWSHDGEVRFDPSGRERFRQAHGCDKKFVVMYSGNHSPCHPLATLLAAADRLAGDPGVVFCFVGGGSEFRKIQDRIARRPEKPSSISDLPTPPPNILCLPYQPLDQLAGSLSAADLHVVVMGNAFVGLVHPCKIYNILSVNAPVLYIGPTPSHVTDIARQLNGQMESASVAHGDVVSVVHQIERIRKRQLNRGGQKGPPSPFSKATVLPRLIELLEAN